MRIHEALKGKTILNVFTDGMWLIVETTTQERIRIGWRIDANSGPVQGEPFLGGQDAVIVIPFGVGASGSTI